MSCVFGVKVGVAVGVGVSVGREALRKEDTGLPLRVGPEIPELLEPEPSEPESSFSGSFFSGSSDPPVSIPTFTGFEVPELLSS